MKSGQKRILIADCHEDILIALERLLEDAGFDTATAWTAKEALGLVDSHYFDLVLINEYLPDAECEEVLKVLQTKGDDIPCIVMQPSAPEIVDFARFEALGVKDIVCKHHFREIVDAVSECLACDQKQLPAA